MSKNIDSPKLFTPKTIALAILFSALGAFLIIALGPPLPKPKPTAPPIEAFKPVSVDRPVPDFALVDQNNTPVTLADLKGKLWVAGFIFTRCKSICPTVTKAMAELRATLPEDVLLVSFSVDPIYDRPEVLAEYAAKFDAQAPRWRFLTGDRDQIYQVIRDGFLLAVEENTGKEAEEGDLVTHSSRVIIVDDAGIARTTYNSLDPASVNLVKRAIEKLRRPRS